MSEDVTQADRDRAAAFMHECRLLLGSTCMTVSVELELRQTLRDHRIAAAKAMQSDEAVERVARAIYELRPAMTSSQLHCYALNYYDAKAYDRLEVQNAITTARAAIRALTPEETP